MRTEINVKVVVPIPSGMQVSSGIGSCANVECRYNKGKRCSLMVITLDDQGECEAFVMGEKRDDCFDEVSG